MSALTVKVAIVCPACKRDIGLRPAQSAILREINCHACGAVVKVGSVVKVNPHRPSEEGMATPASEDGDFLYACNSDWYRETYGAYWRVMWVMFGCGMFESGRVGDAGQL